ncbi:PTS system mannose/fructose/N-acetylgalactosamine-transporter subunit IIB [Enterococcus sp. AZ109]|uniref:PTS system mannose/fructose/N-acetylgalactosamine-transporter subunit IIB n=1 Tax=Enterococcus sp. AZ109 TaxID=2774634 RepID=UPI003F272077
MSEVGLVRVDSRLLHGQVVTRWIGQVDAKEVIIFDDELAKDEFMIEVFQMAAPSGVELIVKSVDEVTSFLDNRELKYSIILFKNIPMLLKGMKADSEMKRVQIGGIGGGPDRVVVFKNITLTKDEYNALEELSNRGVEIYLQTVPEEKEVKLADISNKFN